MNKLSVTDKSKRVVDAFNNLRFSSLFDKFAILLLFELGPAKSSLLEGWEFYRSSMVYEVPEGLCVLTA